MRTGTPVFASGTSTLSLKRGRCALPKDVVDRWKLGSTPGDDMLVSELIGEGHVRLYRRTTVEGRMAAWLKEAEEEESPVLRQQALRAHYDRFRDVSFTATDNNRLALPQPLVLALTGSTILAGKVKLYVELGFDAVDLMMNLARMARQPGEED